MLAPRPLPMSSASTLSVVVDGNTRLHREPKGLQSTQSQQPLGPPPHGSCVICTLISSGLVTHPTSSSEGGRPPPKVTTSVTPPKQAWCPRPRATTASWIYQQYTEMNLQ